MSGEEEKRALNELIELFFDGLYEDFDISFGYLPELYEDEFKSLVDGYASSNMTVNGDVFVDEYVYIIGPFFCDEGDESGARKSHVMKKRLILRYHKDLNEFGTSVYIIVSVSGKTEYAVEEEAV
jgi:hypothetical protein